MKPDSQQIIHSRCWRSMLDDTFPCLLIAEAMKWSTEVFSFSWIKDRQSGPSKKVCRDLYQYVCVKGLKGDLAALCLACIYSLPHVLQFLLMTSNSWGKKKSASSFPAHHFFLFLITGRACLLVCFPLTFQSLPRGAEWDVLMTGEIQKFLQILDGISSIHTQGWNYFQAANRREFVGQSSADLQSMICF